MIRVKKRRSPEIDPSNPQAINRETLERSLNRDQHGKCYVCERLTGTDYQIDHLRPKSVFGRETDWGNLFLACGFCNGRKSDGYREIFEPDKVDIENEIKQEVDFPNNRAKFTGAHSTPAHEDTLALLNRIFNGSAGMRNFREERFFNQFLAKMLGFLDSVNLYKLRPTSETELSLRKALSIGEEYLGFKYWVIRQDPELSAKFREDLVWNKAEGKGV